MSNKYIFITREGDPLPIADRLKDEDKEVRIGMVEDDNSSPSKDRDDCRRQLYEGILEIEPADKVMKWMRDLPDKDQWFFMADYGDLWKESEQALDMGFTKGIFPTEAGYKLEDDRQAGKDFAKKYYPHLKVAPVHEFKKVDDAIKLLEEQKDKIFVLKSEGSNAETVVPQTQDFDLARRQIVGALHSEGKDYERGGFTLEERIRNPIELSPVMVFWNGNPLFSLVELENKPLGAGNIGRLTGGCQNLTIQTKLDCPLNEIAFPPIVYEMAKKQPGISIHDAGLLFDGNDFYFTEFCATRWGWDGIFSEIAMSAGANHFAGTSRHFDGIAAGQNPIFHKYGAAVRLFQTEPSPTATDCYQDGYSVDWLNSVSEHLFFYCIRKEEDQFLSVGYRRDLGVATGAGETAKEAIDMAYRTAEGVAMTGLYYRAKFDFLSHDYFASIMNRLDFLSESGLI